MCTCILCFCTPHWRWALLSIYSILSWCTWYALDTLYHISDIFIVDRFSLRWMFSTDPLDIFFHEIHKLSNRSPCTLAGVRSTAWRLKITQSIINDLYVIHTESAYLWQQFTLQYILQQYLNSSIHY